MDISNVPPAGPNSVNTAGPTQSAQNQRPAGTSANQAGAPPPQASAGTGSPNSAGLVNSFA